MVRVDFLGFVLLLSDISRFDRYSTRHKKVEAQTNFPVSTSKEKPLNWMSTPIRVIPVAQRTL
jgi:hypothetical protein